MPDRRAARLAAALIATLAATASPLAAQDAPPPVAAFGQMPTFTSLAVSPSGDRFSALYRAADADEYQFLVIDRSDGIKPVFAVTQTDELRIRRPRWVRDDRIVFTVRFAAERYGTDTVETRLMGLEPDSGDMIPLFRHSRISDEPPVQIQDNVVSMNDGDPTRITVQYGTRKGVGVFSVPVDRTAAHKTIMRPRDGIDYWMADQKGTVRAGRGRRANGRPRLLLLTPKGKWADRSARLGDDAPSFRILGFAADPNLAYVASNHETETDALYAYDVTADRFTERLFHDETSDVYDVVLASGSGEAIGVTYANEDGEVRWLTEEGQENLPQDVLRRARRTFPDKNITLTGFNRDDTHAALYVDETNRPGAYYLFDIEERAMMALPPQYPALEDVALGEVVATAYEARDGLTIPAFVTLPPGLGGLDEARGLPFVVLPHGGPNARDFAGFDWQAQFLASRGYGVLQMNFRGSDGYGEAFRAAGDRQWGQAMQDDITDGAGWLVEQGHADPARLAIMGNSYGGYAALMGAAKTPDLYRCAVAHAPVTDLPELIRDERAYVGGTYRTRHIGNLWRDRRMLAENSPARRADDIRVPVLLLHGEDDRVVGLEQSERMVRAMKRAGTTHTYVELPKGSHHLDVGDNRVTYLEAVEAFLGDCLG